MFIIIRRAKIAIHNRRPQKPKPRPNPEAEWGLKVIVPDGGFERAFRRFKKKVQNSGLLLDLKEKMEYEKPSIKRKKAKNQAKRRWQKKVESQSLPPKLY